MRRRNFFHVIAASSLVGSGCGRSPATGPEVVVYCALDREFSEPILQQFENETGVCVHAIFDTESTKSVGLAERILREKNHPQCDCFWNNEIANTLRLAGAGRCSAYASPAGRSYPARWRSPDDYWFGFAARARVLIVHEGKLAGRAPPKRLTDLVQPEWKNECVMAKPLFGTTATHAAYLFSVWGEARAKAWFLAFKANGVEIVSGNKRAAVQVGAGVWTMGLTDTDDAAAEIDADRPVRQIFLDQEVDGLGTPLIPNAVSLMGGPNQENARRFIDWVLAPAIEAKLSRSASKQIPLHPDNAQVAIPQPTRVMNVDFETVQSSWGPAMSFLRHEFAG